MDSNGGNTLVGNRSLVLHGSSPLGHECCQSSSSNNEAHLTNQNPKGNKFLHWIIEKVDGNYALKSVSSGFYVDGRNSSFKDRNGAVLMTNRKPQGGRYLQWRIENVGKHYAFKSVSSGLYLNGRNPEHTGNQIWLSGRPQQRYMQWTITGQD